MLLKKDFNGLYRKGDKVPRLPGVMQILFDFAGLVCYINRD